MKKIITVSIILILFLSCQSTKEGTSPGEDDVQIRNLMTEIRNHAIRDDFTDDELNRLFSEYPSLLTPHSQTTQLSGKLRGVEITDYPLEGLKGKAVYEENIGFLFHSENPSHRILSYLLLSSARDSRYSSELLDRIKTEERRGNRIWAGMALLHLRDTHTDELFDFLVETETLHNTQMLPLFISLDRAHIRETAIKKINSEKRKARILAASILGSTGYTREGEASLKKALDEWPLKMKGYAIYPLQAMGAGDLLNHLKPLLNEPECRKVSLSALAASPSEEDNLFVYSLIPEEGPVSEELLGILLKSGKKEALRRWLSLMQEKRFPPGYYFSLPSEHLLRSDQLKDEVIITLKSLENPKIISHLLEALEEKKDEESANLLAEFLYHPDSGVRYWAAKALSGNQAVDLENHLETCIKDPDLRTVALTDLILDHQIDDLQDVYEGILADADVSRDWKRSSLEYLSRYPEEQHGEIFKDILRQRKEDTFVKRYAALGLGRLQEAEALPLILAGMQQEGQQDDLNVGTYLVALSYLQTEEAQVHIEKYLSSDEKSIRELAKTLLEEGTFE